MADSPGGVSVITAPGLGLKAGPGFFVSEGKE